MSLNYQLGKIKDWEKVTKEKYKDGYRMNPVTEALIWLTMSVGLGKITEENIDEWMVRLAFSDRLLGTMLNTDGEDRPITREELVAHVGLATNVRDEPRKAWAKRITEQFFQDQERRLKVS